MDAVNLCAQVFEEKQSERRWDKTRHHFVQLKETRAIQIGSNCESNKQNWKETSELLPACEKELR